MKQNKIIIGLIGGSGCGKSMFCTAAKELGYSVIDGDIIAHDVLQNEAAAAVAAEFGEKIKDSDGKISRQKLAAVVFSDAKALDRLNTIMHAYIIIKMRTLLTDKCIIDAAVLHKTELIHECTHIITVTAPENIRINRIMQRDGIDEKAAKLRIASQPSNEQYIEMSDIVLENNGSFDEFSEKVKECLRSL